MLRFATLITIGVFLFFPLSALAAVGQACVNDQNCAPGERCLLSEEQKNDACVGNGQCQQSYGAQAICREGRCLKITGMCDLTAQPAGPGTGVALPTLDATKPELQIKIDSLKSFSTPTVVPDENEPEKFVAIFPWIGEYIKAVYLYLVGIAGLVAVIVFIHAGFEWMASGGNTHSIEDAKKKILNASIGMVILFGSYTILNAINPRLTRYEGIRVPIIKRVALDFASMETDVNPDGGFDIVGTPNDGFRNTWMYKQAAPQWRNVAYGDKQLCPGGKDPGGNPDCCSSYAYSACGPTSLAMVLRTQGVATSPVDAGAFATEIGARKCNQGTTEELFKRVGDRWDNFEGKAVTPDQALKILKAKTVIPIIASTPRISGCYKKGGHWIVLTGVDEQGLIRVNDSGTGKCFENRDAGDGFSGAKGAGLTAMTQANFRAIPSLYVVVSKDKAFATKQDNPEVFEILAPLFTFDFY